MIRRIEKDELEIKVVRKRLLKAIELEAYEDVIPYVSGSCCWWLADVDEDGSVAYAEGNDHDEDMFCRTDETNTYIRAALDIEGCEEAGLLPGDKFVYCGFVFTLLSGTLAISDNFVGMGAYYDDDLADYIMDDCECTIDAVLETIFCDDSAEDDDDDYEDDCDEDE